MSSIKLSLVVSIMVFILAADIQAEPPAKVDAFGDPLPPGAIARLGTVRWRHADGASFVAFLPDGKTLLSAGGDATVRIWDVATGKELRRFSAVGAPAGGVGMPQVRGIAFAVLVDEFDSSPRKMALSADGSALANALGGPNPTLTIQAVATRTAEQIFCRYFGGDPWVQSEAPVPSTSPIISAALRSLGG